MIERVVLAVFLFLVAFVSVGLWLPDTAHVVRSIEVERPVITVFTLLNRLENFPSWSPWAERDPKVRIALAGPPAGVGARLEWSGDPRQVGTGHLEIVESRSPTLVRSRLQLRDEGSAETRFRIERIAGGARVTWTFDARLDQGQGAFGSLLARYFGLLLDRWIGADFERGLARFKRSAEALPGGDFSGLEVERLQVEAFDLLTVPVAGEAPGRFAEAYGEIAAFMNLHGLVATAQPLLMTRRAPAVDAQEVLAAIPVQRDDTPAAEPVRWGRAPAGAVVRVTHVGPHGQLPETHARLAAWLAVHGVEQAGISWEQYVSNPATTPASERVTQITVLLAEVR